MLTKDKLKDSLTNFYSYYILTDEINMGLLPAELKIYAGTYYLSPENRVNDFPYIQFFVKTNNIDTTIDICLFTKVLNFKSLINLIYNLYKCKAFNNVYDGGNIIISNFALRCVDSVLINCERISVNLNIDKKEIYPNSLHKTGMLDEILLLLT